MDLSDLGEPMIDASMMRIERDPELLPQTEQSEELTRSYNPFPDELHSFVNILQTVKTDTPDAQLNADSYDDGTGKRIRFNESDAFTE